VESLGARFVGVDTAEDAQDASGYARELSQDFYRKQAELLADRCRRGRGDRYGLIAA